MIMACGEFLARPSCLFATTLWYDYQSAYHSLQFIYFFYIFSFFFEHVMTPSIYETWMTLKHKSPHFHPKQWRSSFIFDAWHRYFIVCPSLLGPYNKDDFQLTIGLIKIYWVEPSPVKLFCSSTISQTHRRT